MKRHNTTPKLICEDQNLEINFEDLSSGEQIRFALASSILQSNNRTLPQLLMLDEVDAFLHPDMINRFLNMIETTFVKKNVTVILVTHSPTTIDFAKENYNLYILQDQYLKKSNRMEAFNCLFNGYLTLEQRGSILLNLDKDKIGFISEGSNYEYFDKALSLFKESKIYLVVLQVKLVLVN